MIFDILIILANSLGNIILVSAGSGIIAVIVFATIGKI